jgi:hypothetical protein
MIAIGLESIQKVAEQVSELIKTRIEPAVIVVLEPLRADGKDILRVQVAGVR